MQIEFAAPDDLRKALTDLGRTEDLKLSPNNRRLAISGFAKNKILIVDVDIDASSVGKKVALSAPLEITSPSLHAPHGLFFIDEETLIVANRKGEAPILKLPAGVAGGGKFVLPALQTIRCDQNHRLHSPGSISVSHLEGGQIEVLICNNFAHSVTRHILNGSNNFSVLSNDTLLSQGLDIPDGVAVNSDRRWIAISNHNEHSVFLYENTPRLNSRSEPDGILRGLNYPHGVRFTPDDNFVLVADAGAPYVHVYAKNGTGWRGVHDPATKFRVMDETTYLRGRRNPQEGGPKGIDIDNNMNVLVTTSEEQVLAFFDLQEILQKHKAPKAFVRPAGINPSGFPWA